MYATELLHRIQLLPAGYPSITVLAALASSVPEKLHNHAHVRSLIKKASEELEVRGVDVSVAKKLIDILQSLVASFEQRGEHAAGVLFLVRPDYAAYHLIMAPCRDVIRVGSFFALQELADIYGSCQSYAMVVLSEERARLFVCSEGRCVEVISSLRDEHGQSITGFPLEAVLPEERKLESLKIGDLDARYRTERVKVFMRHVAYHVQTSLHKYAMPYWVVASEGLYHMFQEMMPGTAQPAGHLTGDYIHAKVSELHARADALVRAADRRHEQDYVNEFHAALKVKRQAAGMQRTWEVVQEGRVHLLLVERGFHMMGRIDPDNSRHLQPFDRTPAGVEVDDLVDVLIAHTWAHRGRVVIVPEGALHATGHIGAILRY